MDDLSSAVPSRPWRPARARSTAAAAIVGEEVERYRADERARGAAPSSRPCGPGSRSSGQPSSSATGAVPASTTSTGHRWTPVVRDVLAKVLHQPTVALKEAAGHPPGRAAGRRRCARCSTSEAMVTPTGRGGPGRRLRLATRGSPLALRQADRVADALAAAAHPVCRASSWSSGPPATAGRRPHRPARRPGRLRQGGPVGRARRAGRRWPCTRPRTCPRPRPTGWCWPPCPSGPTPATPWCGAASATSAPGPRWPPVGPAPGPAGLAAARPHLRRPPGEHGHPAGAGRRREGARGGGPGRPGAAGADRARSTEVLDAAACCPRWARGPWPSSAGPTTTRAGLLLAVDDDVGPPGRWAERAFLAALGGRLHPAGRRPGHGAEDDRCASTACWPAATAGSSCGRTLPGARPRGARRGWPRTLLDHAAAASIDGWAAPARAGSGVGDRLPGGRGPRRPGAAHPAGGRAAGAGRRGRLRPAGRPAVLALAPPGGPAVGRGKRPRRRPRSQDEINALLVEHGRAGRRSCA